VKPGTKKEWVEEQIRRIRSEGSDGLHLRDKLNPFGQRNLLGLWVALEGAIYDLNQDIHYVEKVPNHWGEPIDYVGGVDWGFQHPRISILAVYKTSNGEQHYAFVDGWNKSKVVPTKVIAAMETFSNTYDISEWYLPPDQPGLIKLARSSKSNLGYSKIKKAKNNVSAGITVVSRFFNTVRLVILKGTKASELCWEETSGYEWDTDRDGAYKDVPLKKDDHYPDSIRYVIYSRHYRDNLIETKEEPLDDDRLILLS
jgi:hypothetical protein